MEIVLGFFTPGPTEMIIILVVAVLLFGKRLPEVGRSLGKGLMEFKKGIGDIEGEIDRASSATTSSTSYETAEADREEATAPKFEPPSSEPKAESV